MAPGVTAAQQEEYLRRVREQVQAQTIQEIMGKMTEKCFKVRKNGAYIISFTECGVIVVLSCVLASAECIWIKTNNNAL